MKYPFIYTAAMLVATLGVAHAEGNSGEKSTAGATHYTSIEGAYFSDSGFSSPSEDYAKQKEYSKYEKAAVGKPTAGGKIARHNFSHAEYLYFSGRGFASTPTN